MALRYQTRKTMVGFGEVKEAKFVSQVVRDKNVSVQRMVEQVALRSGQPKAVCRAVIDTLVESMGTWMADGQGVTLGSLGILKPTVNCRAGETSGDVAVVRKKILFYPSTETRRMLEDIKVEKITANASSTDEGGGDTGGGNTGGGELT